MNPLSSRPLSPWVTNIFWGIRHSLIVTCVVAAGSLLAYLLISPYVGLTVSIIGVVIHMLISLIAPLGGLLFWFTFYPFTERVVNIPLPAGIPDLSPTRFTIMFLTVMMLAQVAIHKRVWPRLTKIDWAIIGFMAALFLSTMSASDPMQSAQFVFDNYLVPLLIYFLIKNLVVNRNDLNKVLYILLTIGVYGAIFIIAEQLTSYVVNFGSPPDDIIQFNYSYRSYTDSLRLAEVPVLDGIQTLGQVFTMSIPFALYYMFKAPSLLKKALYIFIVGLICIGLFFTYKRAAYLSLPLSLMVIQFFYPQFRRMFWIVFIVVGIFMALTWSQISSSALVTERIQGSQLETANGRTDIWADTWKLWKERPLLGWGFRRTEEIRGGVNATENIFFTILASAGLVGFIPYVLMLIFMISRSIDLYRRAESNSYIFVDCKLIAVFWGAFLPYFIGGLSDDQGALFLNVFFMVLVGSVVGSQEAALHRQRSRNSK